MAGDQAHTHRAEAPAVVFVNAVTRDGADFDDMRMRLGAPSAAVELAGHGGAPRLARYSIPLMADALALPAGPPPIVYAHSLAGCVALHLAARQPGRVRALVLEDPPLFALLPGRTGKSHYHRGFVALKALMEGAGRGYSPADWEAEVSAWGSGHGRTSLLEAMGVEAVRRRARQLEAFDSAVLGALIDGTMADGFDPRGDLTRLACPVVVIAGDRACGSALSADDLRELDGKPFVDVVRVTGEGHFLHEVRPGPCLAPLHKLLAANR